MCMCLFCLFVVCVFGVFCESGLVRFGLCLVGWFVGFVRLCVFVCVFVCLFVCLFVGLLGCWLVGLLVCGFVGLLVCWYTLVSLAVFPFCCSWWCPAVVLGVCFVVWCGCFRCCFVVLSGLFGCWVLVRVVGRLWVGLLVFGVLVGLGFGFHCLVLVCCCCDRVCDWLCLCLFTIVGVAVVLCCVVCGCDVVLCVWVVLFRVVLVVVIGGGSVCVV